MSRVNTSATAAAFELCSAKTISGLGDVTGICPEGPSTAGSYFMAGIAHHAKKNRIRTDITPPEDALSLEEVGAWEIDPVAVFEIRQDVADFILTLQ